MKKETPHLLVLLLFVRLFKKQVRRTEGRRVSVFGLAPFMEQGCFRNRKPLESERTNIYGAVVCYTKLASRTHIFEYPRWVLSVAFDYQMSSVG